MSKAKIFGASTGWYRVIDALELKYKLLAEAWGLRLVMDYKDLDPWQDWAAEIYEQNGELIISIHEYNILLDYDLGGAILCLDIKEPLSKTQSIDDYIKQHMIILPPALLPEHTFRPNRW